MRKKKEKYIESESGTFSKAILKKLFRDYRIFVILVLLVFWRTGSEPMTLVTGVTAFFSIEVWQLARIKINKEEKKEEEDDDRNNI